MNMLLRTSALCSLLAVCHANCVESSCKEGYLCVPSNTPCKEDSLGCGHECEAITDDTYCSGVICGKGEVCGAVRVPCIGTCSPVPACVPEEKVMCNDEVCSYPNICVEESPSCTSKLCPIEYICKNPADVKVSKCDRECEEDETCSLVPVMCDLRPCPEIYTCQKVVTKTFCGEEICSSGETCKKNDDHCTNPYRCQPVPKCTSVACCSQFAVCKEGFEQSDLCTDSDYESGECIWERRCCSATSCKRIPSQTPSIPKDAYKNHKGCTINQQVDYCVAKEMGWDILVNSCGGSCELSVGICSSTRSLCGELACTDGGELTKYSCRKTMSTERESKRLSDPCVLGPCSSDELCHGENGVVTCKKRSQIDACCQAMPTCFEFETPRTTPCSYNEVTQGTCRRVSRCCSEVFCAVDMTYSPSPVDSCASKPCPEGFVCSSDSESDPLSFTCSKRPPFCCQQVPVCPIPYIASDKDCLPGEIGCHRETKCCDEIFCRSPTGRSDQSADCALQPCGSGTFCVELFDESRFACVDTFLTCGNIRCAAFDVQCPAGMKESDTGCDIESFERGDCVRLSNPACCQQKFCKAVPSEGDSESRWEWIAVGAAFGTLFMTVIFLCIWKVCVSDSPQPVSTLRKVSVVQSAEPGFMYPYSKEVQLPPVVDDGAIESL